MAIRISGPLLGRIEIHCEVALAAFRELSTTNTGESSEAIWQRVAAARGIQLEHIKKSSNSTNYSVASRRVRQHCQLNAGSIDDLDHAMEEMNFSTGQHDRFLNMAWTLVDVAGAPDIRLNDILEAFQYRSLDSKVFS